MIPNIEIHIFNTSSAYVLSYINRVAVHQLPDHDSTFNGHISPQKEVIYFKHKKEKLPNIMIISLNYTIL